MQGNPRMRQRRCDFEQRTLTRGDPSGASPPSLAMYMLITLSIAMCSLNCRIVRTRTAVRILADMRIVQGEDNSCDVRGAYFLDT